MKKSSAVLIAFCFLTTVATAQMQLGPKLGLNISNLHGNDAGESKSKLGFTVGAFFNVKLNDYLAIQPEVYYTTKGAKDTTIYDNQSYDYTFALEYVEIPLLVKVLIPLGSKIRSTIFVGPSIAFNSSAKVKTDVDGVILEADYDYIKSTELGLVLGAGIGFPMGKNEIGFDARYNLGLTTIDDLDNNADVKNNVININFYFAAPF